MMYLKFKKLTETAIEPTRGTVGSAGLDLYSDNQEEVMVYPRTSEMVKTGIAMEIPAGYFGAIYPRSGISTKQGLRLANCVAVIDSDYRGEIHLPMHNDGCDPVIIKPGTRLAQIVFHKYAEVNLNEVDNLSETERGTGGFGSTGE